MIKRERRFNEGAGSLSLFFNFKGRFLRDKKGCRNVMPNKKELSLVRCAVAGAIFRARSIFCKALLFMVIFDII